MYCVTNLDIFYNEKEDLLKIAHCCYDRVGQSLGEINYNDFHKLSENDFYDYLNKIVFTKPVDCYIMNPGKTCLDVWKSNNYEVGTVRVAISRECNLHCPMCYVRYGGHHDSLKRKQLYLYTIEKLKNYKFKTLWLTDWGEGFIYLNEVLDIMKTYKYCKNINITTNATLITEDLLQKLVDTCNHIFLEIDFDGLSQKSLESVRAGANFAIVFKNILKVISYRNKYPTKFELLLHFTKNKINEKDLDQIKAFADKEKIPLFIGEEFEVPKESIFNY